MNRPPLPAIRELGLEVILIANQVRTLVESLSQKADFDAHKGMAGMVANAGAHDG